ncbi:hypothetical protein BC938DRAFT_472661 [Jimgerdemannia flammicorona]|uniref:ADF-H domain-containing protein n=1 Tax=Jimgerdemannia flammicorona TaxID=994334 RepID=A0A433Q5M7_9FUNG|nr:hypothetical protein BC938DRAFT_472661 [Jimgerdemannia flammicorona]
MPPYYIPTHIELRYRKHHVQTIPFTETLVVNGTTPVTGTWEEDFDAIQTYLEPPNPAYVFYRLDTKSASSDEYDWLFLAYVPDNAKVRDKMLYASTRATLTKGLGDARFKDSVYGTTEAEFTLDGYKKHKRHQAADAPLTARERELAEIKAIEAKESFNAQGTTVRRTYAAGVAFPLSEQALEAVRALAAPKGDRAHNFVQLRIEKEIVELTSAEQIETANLVAAVPGDAPRFTLHQVEYEVQGEVVEALGEWMGGVGGRRV